MRTVTARSARYARSARSVVLLALALLPVVVSGCAADASDDDVDVATQALSDQAQGKDPCADPAIRKKVTVKASGDGHKFVGTDKDDVIFGTTGKDEIYGSGGDDVICGLDGDDFIDGGDGKDKIFAGPGDDVVHGRGGSDHIFGGPGNDILFGDILDDHIFGEDGDDVLIGGHGTDELSGGKGNDWLRGDTGNDSFEGGDDNDVVSFATAMPPGQPEIVANAPNKFTGVEVKFPDTCGASHQGCANGDGGNEPMDGVEQILGSPYTDHILAGGRVVTATYGDDVVTGAAVTSPGATPASYVYLDAHTNSAGSFVDVGIIIIASKGADDVLITGSGTTVDIASRNGKPLNPGTGCTAVSAEAVRCAVADVIAGGKHGEAPFHFVAAYADDGDDKFELAGDFPREFEAHVSGGEGSDHLIGSDEQDVFFSGPSGTDNLEGRGGDDALLSESHHTAMWDAGDRPNVADYKDGPDTLDGGEGNDQLVADYVCGGHHYIGGAGNDIAGFARSGYHPIHAQLGGPSTLKTNWYGYAANMDLCGDKKGQWTSWKVGNDADLETLEASDGPDYLWGDDRANTIWGRDGADHIWGLGGDDIILGAGGEDVIDPGPGKNTVSYGAN